MNYREGKNDHRITGWPRSDFLFAVCVLFLVVLSVARILSTHHIFTQTYDEPYHLFGGMKWLEKGKRSTVEQPPLAQVAIALGPYLKGLRCPSDSFVDRLSGAPDVFAGGSAILYSDGDYWHNLRLARLGTLPFLILACIVIFLWARRWFSGACGFWAVLLFVSTPPVLGHAGLATVDMACTAMVSFALYRLVRWLEEPTWRQSIGFGIALGLAFLTKYSSLLFLAICCVVAIVYFVLAKREVPSSNRQFRLRLKQACIAGCVTLVCLLAGFRFSCAPISSKVGPVSHHSIDRRFGTSPLLRNLAYKAVELPLPLNEMALGLKLLIHHNNRGHDSYLLGEFRKTGWWYFFPVVLGVKTPIGFLLLGIGGIIAVLWRRRSSTWQHRLSALFPIGILLVCMTSRLDLGVRHALPIYPLLALMAGHAISTSFQNRRLRIISVVLVLLAITVVIDSWMAHPDYLAYFNQLAQGHPEKILCESDLDWGQDLHRLSQRLKALNVREVAIRYFGTALLEKSELPPYRFLSPDERATGYIAISSHCLNLEYAKNGAYGWLKHYTPLETVGKSIYLYRIDQ